MAFLANVYIFIGAVFVLAILLQPKFGLVAKLCITLVFALTVLWAERPDLIEAWLWKCRMIINF